MPSPKDTGGPIVKTGPTKGQNRSKNDNGQWRKKRNDSGSSRGKKRGLCFITTAVCNHRGLEDNCRELETLRKFRDKYLLKTAEGNALVQEYYKIAPEIAVKITHPHDLQYAWEAIQKCILLIESNENIEAIYEYKKMVYQLSAKLLTNHQAGYAKVCSVLQNVSQNHGALTTQIR